MKNISALTKFIAAARELGALNARIIEANSVVTAHWVRLKCQYGCDGYGQKLTCPPYSPTPEQTAKVLKDYKKALLIHGSQHVKVTRIAIKLEREIFLAGFHKAFALGSGPCQLCSECTLGECRHCGQARPAMEACGIDVYQTARHNGFPIQVVKKRSDQQNYYSMVLID